MRYGSRSVYRFRQYLEQRGMTQMVVNNELERMCYEVMTYLRYYPGMRLGIG
jgi:hypothetical protein